MKHTRYAILIIAALVVIASAVFGVRYANMGKKIKQQEIQEFLEQFRPEVPAGVTLVKSQGQPPEKATMANIEEHAKCIVQAHTKSINSPFRDEHGAIYHTVTLQIDSILKGGGLEEGQLIEVQVPGGTIDDTIFWAPENPHFGEGEESIVFISQFEGPFFVTFNAYGKVDIQNGRALGIDEDQGRFDMPLEEYKKELGRYIND